jgi:nitroreductase
MQTQTPEALEAQLGWRYAVKKFDASYTIPAAQWSALEKSLLLSPSSFGLQPWKFVIVTDPAVKAKLLPLSWNQPQITTASHLVVFAAKSSVQVADADKLIDRMVQVRGTPREALQGYRDMMAGFIQTPPPGFDARAWAAKQCYIALGVFMTAAATLGIDTCPMEGINPAGYDEVLGLGKDGYATVVVATAGRRAPDDKSQSFKKVRYEAGEIIRHV